MCKVVVLWFGLVMVSGMSMGATHALLIGIGDYGDPTLRLQGPANDVALVRAYIEETCPAVDMRVLLDHDATHGNILAEFERLSKVNPGDTVYIYFSGHGSQTADLNGDEVTNPFDETWVSYGTRKGAETLDDYDVLDDEIFHHLSRIPTDRVVFISDSCHAGSVGHDQNERTLERDTRSHPEGRKYTASDDLPGIRLSAVKDNQLAIEKPIPLADGSAKVHGLFTWCLVAALRETEPTGNWHEVLLRTKALMRTHREGRDKEPQLEGDGGLRLDLSDQAATEGTVALSGKVGDHWILEVGQTAGVCKGTRFLHRDGNREILLDIAEAGLFFSKAVKVSGPEPKIGNQFHLQSIGMDGAKIKMSAAAALPGDEGHLALLERTVRAKFPTQIDWEPQAARADWVLWLVRPSAHSSHPFQLPPSTPDAPLNYWLTDGHAEPLLRGSLMKAEASGQRFEAGIEWLLRRSSLLRLNNPNHRPDFQFVPEFYSQEKTSSAAQADLVVQGRTYQIFSPPDDTGNLPKDCLLVPTLKNLSAEPRYLYILNFAPDGEVALVFPRRGQRAEMALFEPGEERRLAKLILLLGESGWERFRVLSSARVLDSNMFNLRRDRNESASREVGRVAFDGNGDDWSTALYSYKVMPAKLE